MPQFLQARAGTQTRETLQCFPTQIGHRILLETNGLSYVVSGFSRTVIVAQDPLADAWADFSPRAC